jgi:putative DNA primase/helicase
VTAPDHKVRFKLLSDEEVTNLPPTAWRIDQYLPQGGLAFLYGPSGAGKSFLALSWAMAVATGADWMGRRVNSGPVGPIQGNARQSASKADES